MSDEAHYGGPERRESQHRLERRVAALERNLKALEGTVTGVQAEMYRNTEITAAARDNTETLKDQMTELIELFQGMKFLGRVMRGTGRVLGWAAGIAAAGGTIYAAVRGLK